MQNQNKFLKKRTLLDGLFKQNIVLMSGMVTASVIAAATTVQKAFVICVVFSLVSFFTIAICRFISRKIVYTIRIILYALIASAIYIPVIFGCNYLWKETVDSVGIYLPVVVTNSLILSKTESRFCMRPFKTMLLDILAFIAGFDMVCILIAMIRELFSENRIGNLSFYLGFQLPSLKTTFGGFLLVGILAGLFRAIYNAYKKGQKEKYRRIQKIKRSEIKE